MLIKNVHIRVSVLKSFDIWRDLRVFVQHTCAHNHVNPVPFSVVAYTCVPVEKFYFIENEFKTKQNLNPIRVHRMM